MWKGRKENSKGISQYPMEAATTPQSGGGNWREKVKSLQGWILSWDSALWWVNLEEELSGDKVALTSS